MKKFTLIAFLLSSVVLFAQTTYVPNDNFEQALIDLGYDDVLDDYVLTANISGVTSLDVSVKNISDLTGIEGFTALTHLDCTENYATQLDVTQNMGLQLLNCAGNYLTQLDVTQNTELQFLDCAGNPTMTQLDVTQNTALIELDCIENYLTQLDVTQNTALQVLNCADNYLSGLYVSQNTALIELSCYNNQLTQLNVSQNTDLIKLNCQWNELTTLDISQNTALEQLYCDDNQISTLDVTHNTVLIKLFCNENQLTSLNLTQNVELAQFWCFSNQLTNIDIRNGNNLAINNSFFNATDNPNLTCIFVDDADWCVANWIDIDPNSTFVETQAECDALGIDEVFLSEGLQVYPNPTKGILNIEDTILFDEKYTIYNIYGAICKQGVLDNDQIDISALKVGIYLLKLGDMSTKIVKL